MSRPLPAACLDLIHEFEGTAGQHEAVPTQDPGGVWEIGWSHKLDGPTYPGAPIDRATADHIALNDLSLAADAVQAALGAAIVPNLTDGQYAALIDFTYNEGAGAFASSTLCKLVRMGAYKLAAEQFDRWIYASVDGRETVMNGLIRRRAAEKALFVG